MTMLAQLKALIAQLRHGPRRTEYRIRYCKGGAWKLTGWYLEMRGGGYGWFWGSAHTMPFNDKDIAEKSAMFCANRDNGIFVGAI